ncbi:LysR substrate-binding domain-containing protein [Stappia indica]|uniref:Transcriptional regulator, LysR family n=1 Tax=Stappia indica TaxID=538381 RepID=A0A285SED2_9HYPH|nr:LysR substrate-binding domain-containing protein [Stappia indica]SOC06247.1 transcriptional regulator, LysR family [Stappia indica]
MSEPTQKHFRIVERILTRLKLKQLRLLVAVERHNSILHAARELNLSQPAATKLIKDLETDFGVMLFERTNRGVVPTIYGEALARHGKLIFAQISHAAQELDDLSEGSSGRIVVGTLLAASALLLPRTIARVLAEKPNLSIKIQEGTNEVLMPALRSGELDLVVGRLPTHRHRDELLQERLYEEKVIAVTRVGHPLQERRKVTFADMMDYGWILPPPETTLRRQIDMVFLDHGLSSPINAVESVSFLANRSLLVNSSMIGVLPSHVAEQDIAAGILARVSWDVPIPIGPVGVSYRKGRSLTPAASFFLEQLRQVAATF